MEATAEALRGTISNDIGIKWDYQVGLPFKKHLLMGPVVFDYKHSLIGHILSPIIGMLKF